MNRKKLPKIKECIAYIESCGWKFIRYNSIFGWYIFKPNNAIASFQEISFSLTEIRMAYKNGW